MSAGCVHSQALFGLVISPSHHLCHLITCWVVPGIMPVVDLPSHTLSWIPPATAVTAASSVLDLSLHLRIVLLTGCKRKWICNSKVVCRTKAYFTHDLSHGNPPVSSSKLNFINFEALLSLQIYFYLKRMFLFKHYRSKGACSTFKKQVSKCLRIF